MRSKKALYNIITNLILQLAAVIYGFVVPKIIIDNFGSDVNGLIVSITQFLAYISLLESGFGPVVKAVLYKPIARKDNKTIADILKTSEKFFRRIALIFVLYIMVLCAVFPFIAGADFDAIFTISLIVIVALSTFAEYFFGMAYRLFLQAEQKTYVISIIQIVTYILATILIVVLAKTGANVIVIKLAGAIIFLLRPIIQNIYVRKKYKIDFKDASSNYKIKQKWDGLAQHIASVVHNNTDVVVLTIFATLADVSIYAVYNLVLAGIKRIIQSFSNGIDAIFGDMIAKQEGEVLQKKFSAYELLYMMIATILFAVTLVLITPFVTIYTSGVTDADYVRPIFGCLLALSEFIWAVRLPYSTLTLAAGHFKETRKGAWVEAIVNILISVALVFNFGIIGVAIGTIIAMFIRTVEFVYHANKYILKRDVWASVGKISIAAILMAVAVAATFFIDISTSRGYVGWISYAIIATLIAGIVTFVVYYVIYRKDMKNILKKVKHYVNRKNGGKI